MLRTQVSQVALATIVTLACLLPTRISTVVAQEQMIELDHILEPGSIAGVTTGSVPYVFRVYGVDIDETFPGGLSQPGTLDLPPGSRGFARRPDRQLIAVLMSTGAAPGHRVLGLNLPDGRRLEASFDLEGAREIGSNLAESPSASDPEQTAFGGQPTFEESVGDSHTEKVETPGRSWTLGPGVRTPESLVIAGSLRQTFSNLSFESDDGWVPNVTFQEGHASYTFDNERASHGDRSAKITSDGMGASWYTSDFVPIDSAKRYRMSYDAAGTAGIGLLAYGRLECFSAVTGFYVGGFFRTLTVSENWQRAERFITPDDFRGIRRGNETCDKVKIKLGLSLENGARTLLVRELWFDNIVLVVG